MANNTLGGLIKDYRLQKRISQLEVSLNLGWKDTSRLSKIEQGRVSKPKRETIDRIIEALGMDEYEKGSFLYNTGYLPNEDEIQAALLQMQPKLDDWPYPGYLMDFSFRLIYCNGPDMEAVGYPATAKDEFNKLRMNVLELPFLPKDQFWAEVRKGEDEENLRPFSEAQIAAFKTENFKFQNESWYKSLVLKLSKNNEFRKLWVKIGPQDYYKKLLNYEFKISKIKQDGKEITLKFHLFTSQVIKSPQLHVTLYEPADEFTRDYFLNPKSR